MQTPKLPPWVLLLRLFALAGFVVSIETWHGMLEEQGAAAGRLRMWVVWAVLTPLIVWMAVRWRSPAVHVAGSVACGLVSAPLTGSPAGLGAVFGIICYWDIWAMTYAVMRYRQVHRVALRAAVLEKQLAAAELRALRMQLQPHFLFNALNSINSLMRTNPRGAERMVALLGDFLRMTLESSGPQTVTLARELEFLRAYLEIEQVRFGQRLDVQFDIQEAALKAEVPNLILQPIVENAIRHGVSQRREGGLIEVRGARKNGTLELRVTDNGPGFPTATGSRTGVGLENTRSRLESLFGGAARMVCLSPPSGGSVVVIEVPVANG